MRGSSTSRFLFRRIDPKPPTLVPPVRSWAVVLAGDPGLFIPFHICFPSNFCISSKGSNLLLGASLGLGVRPPDVSAEPRRGRRKVDGSFAPFPALCTSELTLSGATRCGGPPFLVAPPLVPLSLTMLSLKSSRLMNVITTPRATRGPPFDLNPQRS